MYVKNNLLFDNGGTQIRYEHTDNSWANNNPLYLIIHYTAGISMSGAINHFKTRYQRGNASAHIIVDKDGTVVQMVKFNRKAWHAGISNWGEINGLNHYSIGIELVNAGKLEKTDSGDWINWSGKNISSNEVIIRPHKNDKYQVHYGWQMYTNEQIESLIEVSNALNDRYNFIDILGHDDISPGRKIDPGPAFNMISFRSIVLGR
ncbi:MAG: N-acetylmuramoyl-L-alanine amidase [Bacteroidota bacterium]